MSNTITLMINATYKRKDMPYTNEFVTTLEGIGNTKIEISQAIKYWINTFEKGCEVKINALDVVGFIEDVEYVNVDEFLALFEGNVYLSIRDKFSFFKIFKSFFR